MPTVVRRTLFFGVLVLAILACNLPVSIAPTPDPGAAFTSAAQTVAAAVNQTLVPTQPQPALFTALPADTFTPLPPFTATLSPTPIFTATSSTPMISVSVDTNCRVGPGKIYDYLGGLYVGQTAEVYGRDAASNYWYIRLPENPNIFCWVTGQYATVVGNASALPVFTPPPTPTPKPDFEMTYAGMDSCVGWWLEFKLKNIGPFPFKSYSIVVMDITTSTTLTDSDNGFMDMDGCLASGIIASLDPGKSYTLSGPTFVYNPNNHKIKATIALCTEIGLGGQCINHTIEFKP
jgi:hypothetical protein